MEYEPLIKQIETDKVDEYKKEAKQAIRNSTEEISSLEKRLKKARKEHHELLGKIENDEPIGVGVSLSANQTYTLYTGE